MAEPCSLDWIAAQRGMFYKTLPALTVTCEL